MAVNDVARAYASALLDIGQNKNALSGIEEEIDFINTLLAEEKGLMLYFNAPGISKEVKKNFIDKVFSKNFSETTVNVLKLLIDKNRQTSIKDIHEALVELIDEINNRLNVKLVTSTKLSAEALKKIKDSLESKFKKEIILNEVIDEKILGGIVIRIGDLIIDGSVANDLRNMKEKLLYSKVRSESAYED